MNDAGIRTDVAVAVENGRVAAVDTLGALRERFSGADEIDCRILYKDFKR